jgi:hypothetical protein
MVGIPPSTLKGSGFPSDNKYECSNVNPKRSFDLYPVRLDFLSNLVHTVRTMKGIPQVRDWKVTDKNTGRFVIVSTINKRFARWEASDLGINGNVSVSPVRPLTFVRQNGVSGVVRA